MSKKYMLMPLGVMIIGICISIGIHGFFSTDDGTECSALVPNNEDFGLVMIARVNVTTTAPSTYNSRKERWETKAMLENGSVVRVISNYELANQKTITVNKMAMRYQAENLYFLYLICKPRWF